MYTAPLTHRLYAALEKIIAWKEVFTLWQTAAHEKSNDECAAISNHWGNTICTRVELSALTRLLLDKGVFSEEAYQRVLLDETEKLNVEYEERFSLLREIQQRREVGHTQLL